MLRRSLLLSNILCCLSVSLCAETEAEILGEAPQIVPSSFAVSDTASQPVALWMEQGTASISYSAPADAGAALLLLAQRPTAQVCILLNAPETQISSLRFRLRLVAGEASSHEALDALEWELAGVPLRLIGEGGCWHAEFHVTETGWHPLFGGETKVLGDGWHTLTLEFSVSSPRRWRMRWDDGELSSWLPHERSDTALLVMKGGGYTDLWMDDIMTVAPVFSASPSGRSSEEEAAVLAARNNDLREEIAAALRDLVGEAGSRRQLLRRSASTLRLSSLRLSVKRRLEVLTPLEGKQSINEAQ